VNWIQKILAMLQLAALCWMIMLLSSQSLLFYKQKEEKISPTRTVIIFSPFPTVIPPQEKKNNDIVNNTLQEDVYQETAYDLQVRPPQSLCSPMEGVSLRELHQFISDGYHPPPSGSDERHMGVDFAFYRGQMGKEIHGFEVNAILPGVAAAVIFDRPPYGNMVIIETRCGDIDASFAERLGITSEKSLYHLYAHLENAPAVDMGFEVFCGQFLGRVGSSGVSSNPHLHLETRYGKPGARFTSLGYDRSASPQIAITDEEKKNYFLWRTSEEFQHFDPMKIFILQEAYQ